MAELWMLRMIRELQPWPVRGELDISLPVMREDNLLCVRNSYFGCRLDTYSRLGTGPTLEDELTLSTLRMALSRRAFWTRSKDRSTPFLGGRMRQHRTRDPLPSGESVLASLVGDSVTKV